ncbi:hypothetical protein LP420_21980 [Massilia sp. B-10]|nr:hypothetical protein LP420_21980 [Massilia sp. B-10]
MLQPGLQGAAQSRLRGPYANTFRLLSLCGLEITLFSDYACACAEQGLALAAQNEERARLLVQFIDQWHNPALLKHALLRDMARHEHAVSELERADDVAGAPQGQAAAPGPDSKLCPRGAMRLPGIALPPARDPGGDAGSHPRLPAA